MQEEVSAKRALGNGKWDRKLKERMVEFSQADNYDDAKHEWKATGRCWWRRHADREAPSWVTDTGHGGKCLCGHTIVYHFEIENTVTGHRDIVGSDHINSYLILREITDSQNISESEVTEAMIQEWIDVRVKSMMKEAWWEEEGEEFTEMFDACKEMDLRINVRTTGSEYWDETLRMNRPITFLRKKADGRKMASLVWRWNHPDNPKAQINTRGYPNKKLLHDLTQFDLFLEDYMEQAKEMDAEEEDRKKYLKRLDLYEKDKIVEAYNSNHREGMFRENCNKLGIPWFDITSTLYTSNERARLRRDKQKITYMVAGQEGRVFTSAQSQALRDLLDMKWGTTVKASESQMRLLGRLTDDYPKDRNITMRECSLLIEAHKSPAYKKQAILDELATMNSWFKAKAKELETAPEA